MRHGAGHLAHRGEALAVVQRLLGVAPLGLVDADQHDVADPALGIGDRRRRHRDQPFVGRQAELAGKARRRGGGEVGDRCQLSSAGRKGLR